MFVCLNWSCNLFNLCVLVVVCRLSRVVFVFVIRASPTSKGVHEMCKGKMRKCIEIITIARIVTSFRLCLVLLAVVLFWDACLFYFSTHLFVYRRCHRCYCAVHFFLDDKAFFLILAQQSNAICLADYLCLVTMLSVLLILYHRDVCLFSFIINCAVFVRTTQNWKGAQSSLPIQDCCWLLFWSCGTYSF